MLINFPFFSSYEDSLKSFQRHHSLSSNNIETFTNYPPTHCSSISSHKKRYEIKSNDKMIQNAEKQLNFFSTENNNVMDDTFIHKHKQSSTAKESNNCNTIMNKLPTGKMYEFLNQCLIIKFEFIHYIINLQTFTVQIAKGSVSVNGHLLATCTACLC